MWLADQSQSCRLRAAGVALLDTRKRGYVTAQGALACLASLRFCVKSEYKTTLTDVACGLLDTADSWTLWTVVPSGSGLRPDSHGLG